MTLSPEELGRIHNLVQQLVHLGMKAGIEAARSNPNIPPDRLHELAFANVQPYIAMHFNQQAVVAQITGNLTVDRSDTSTSA